MNQEGCKVQIVYGRSGVGKTHFLCSELIERSLLDPAGHYYMIVPEQSTMEMQKRLSMMHPDGGVMDIDILSFVRLTYRVFEELHVKTDQVLEDVGKTMVISYLLEQHKDELAIFGKSAGRAGFHEEMKSMICELFQYGIHREDVERTMEGLPEGSILYLKLHDLLLVYDSFREYISGHYIVAEQLLDLVSGYVCQSEKLKGAVLYFDGFTGFTPLQYVLLDKLMSVAGELRVSVTMPAPQSAFEQEHHLFHMGYEMLHRITGLAKRHAGAVLLSPLGVEEGAHSRLSASLELSCLEKNLFVFPYEKWEAEPKDIHAFCARTARDEITQVAGRIRRLVMDEGLRYRDIAVVSGDLHSVAYLAEEIMPQYGIPYFIDESVDMCTNPFVTWVLALWRITAFDYQLADVVSYLKTGYSDGVGLTDAGLLENYALARNLHSRGGWRREAADARVETLRQSFVKEMDAFRALRKGKTVRDILTAVYKFTVEMHIEEKLAAQARMFAERGQHSQSSVYEQIYPEMMALFDKLVDILGEEQMSAQAFYTVLETGVKSLDIGMIPQGMDQVVLGDITRSRIEDIKVLFLINVNEGVIPKGVERGMILSERDRDALRTEIELAPGGRIRSYQEQFYLYLILTKPEEQLYLSYHKLQSDNKPVKPSYLISRICAVFPKLSVREEEEKAAHRHIYTREEGLTLLLDLLTEYGEEEIADGEAVDREQSEAGKETDRLMHGLLQLYRDSPEEEMLLRGLAYPVREEDLPEALVKELYGSRVSASISRLEKYAGCAFAFFLQYGLKLKERKLFEISTADTGDILHKTMELVFTYFKERQGVRLASEEALEEKTREVLDEIVHSEDYAEIFEASNRNGYLQNILENVAVSSVRALKGHLKSGQMEPEAFELPFGGGKNSFASFQLKEDVSMQLKGIVDRVDVLADEAQNKLYVQVIDYKSGDKHLDYTKLFYGTQIQLVIYMNIVKAWAARQHPGMEIVPVGMYYFHMHNPMVSGGEDADTGKAWENEMRLSGVTVADSHIVSMVDNGPGRVVEVGFKKDGDFTSASKIARRNHFDAICKYAYEKAETLGKDMYAGKIPINPYKLGAQTACDYCAFGGICLFDGTGGKQQYRYFSKKEKEVFGRDEMDEGTAKGN